MSRRGLVPALVAAAALAAPAAAPAGKHDDTREAIRDKSKRKKASSSSSAGADVPGCASCLGAACEVGAEAALSTESDDEAYVEAEAAPPGYVPPPGFADEPLVAATEPAPPLSLEAAQRGALGPSWREDQVPPRLDARAGTGAVLDVSAAGSLLLAELPNAAADASARLESRGAGPGVEAWYTGLGEREPGDPWDHLPLGGLRLSFAFASDPRPYVRLGGAVLGLGPGEAYFALDAGGGLEASLGGPAVLELGAGALVFDGFVAADVDAGVAFRFDPVYVRPGVRFLWLEGAYGGPTIGFGARF